MQATDYSAFGVILEDREYYATITTTDKYRYGFNGKEADNETCGDGNEYDYGARVYDARLGRWLSCEPLQMKYPYLSPYCFASNTPSLFLDIDGKDWFVNNNTGQVIYVRDASKITNEIINQTGTGGTPADYERLGPNNMFGEKLKDGTLNMRIRFIELSEVFMKDMGYAKAEKLNIVEKENTIKNEENTITIPTFDEDLSSSKITYVTPEKLNTKENMKKDIYDTPDQTTTIVSYLLTKPFGQNSRKTSVFAKNNILTDASFWELVKSVTSVLYDSYFSKKKTK
ncbi:MAG: hypothetical protein KBB37_05200 [Bacteroidia bacterium]|nr:hypothetical protein [Bacteroidia bacterium]MBP7260664.1 hypothetical protein [Bacteroidia bacterium]MBP9724306.1 hypothetical protein [Bacteroidia bacterium]